MDRRYLAVFKIRLALVPSSSRNRKPPPLNIFFMKEESAGLPGSSDEMVVQSYVTGDFPNDRAIENYSLEVYDKVKRGGKNEHLILHPDGTSTPKSDKKQKAEAKAKAKAKAETKPEPEPGASVSKKRDSGATIQKIKPRKGIKEIKKLRILPSRLKARKSEDPSAVPTSFLINNVKVVPSGSYTFLSSLSADKPYGKCDPEAVMYRLNFQEKKVQLCKRLFQVYNQNVFENKLPQNLQMTWSKRLKKSAGITHNKYATSFPEVLPRSSRIVFSVKVCDTPDRLRDTLIHELCHAACWLVDELKNGHGGRWKFWAKKAMAVFPELPSINRCHNYVIFTKYSYKCASCGYTIGRHSRSLDTINKRCGHCYGVFELYANTKRASGTVSRRKVRN